MEKEQGGGGNEGGKMYKAQGLNLKLSITNSWRHIIIYRSHKIENLFSPLFAKTWYSLWSGVGLQLKTNDKSTFLVV